jgi:CO/xanthine dehydrogenase Mo-binding subunit
VDAQTQGTISPNQVDSWVAILSDGTVTAYSGKCDFGQGFRTVQQQLVAEELTVPLNRIKMVICDTALTPHQGRGARGIHAIRSYALRQAWRRLARRCFKWHPTSGAFPKATWSLRMASSGSRVSIFAADGS